MWRFFYTIGRNLFRFPGILSRMRKLAHQEPYSEQESYDCLKYVTGELLRTGHIRVDGFGLEHLPQEGGYLMCPNHQGKLDAFAVIAAQ